MISKEQFVNVMGAIEKAQKSDDKLSELLKTEGFICYSSELIDSITATLTDLFNDENDWVGYWLYELNYGESWTVDTCSRADGSVIKIKTAENLYDFLLEVMCDEERKL